MLTHAHTTVHARTCIHIHTYMHTYMYRNAYNYTHTPTCSRTQIRCKKPSQTSCYAWKWARSKLGLLLRQVEEAAAADLALHLT